MLKVGWGMTVLNVEPAVMLATLNVHEAMGQKVDREAVATLVLPQLWTMSTGPCWLFSIYIKAPTYLLCSTQRRPVYTLHEVCLLFIISFASLLTISSLQRDQDPQ